MPKVFLATPAFIGKVDVPYAIALAETQLLLASSEIEVVMRITTSGSLLVAERNRLVEAFRNSDCTHMLFIDSDLGWPPMAVKALLDHDLDFVAGVYPTRGIERTFTFRPVTKSDGSIVISDKGLLKCDYIPAGFMLMKKQAIEKMCTAFPELYFKPKDSRCPDDKGYCLFNTELWNGEFWGEDYFFCRKAREAGLEIWVDPMIQFNHAGTVGMLRDVLTTEKKKDE